MDLIVYDGKIYADSRDVAEMVKMRHADLIRNIERYIDVLSKNAKLRCSDYFIERTYHQAGNGKEVKRYDITKIGCDMVANKLTGEKGILFTAAYVKQFDEMQKELSTPKLTPSPRYRSRRLSTAVDDMEKTAEALSKIFKVNAGIAYSKAISMIEPLYGVSFDTIKDLLPAAQHDTGFLTATQIGEKIGKSAKETNLLMAGLGLQHKEGKEWRLDDAGREYGEVIPYTADSGHSGYQIKWNEKVVEFLLQQKKA